LALLGPFQAWTAAGATQNFRTLKERALLSYLVVEHGRAHSREALAEMFWPDRPDSVARNNLRQALHGLRQAVGGHGFDAVFSVTAEDVQVALTSSLWLDTAAYDVHLKSSQIHNHALTGPCPYCLQHLRDAVELYRGPFLEDITLEKNDQFQEWLAARRDSFHRQQALALEFLVQEHERMGDFPAAAMYAVQQARMEDAQENHYRRLMHLLVKVGQTGSAMEWYETARRNITGKLGLILSEETEALAQLIRSGQAESAAQAGEIGGARQNLAENLTPFTGREMEMAQVAQFMENPGCRLVSLVGPGGVGKTRLALQIARIHLRAFPDGVYFVALDAVADPNSLFEMIGNALGLVAGPDQEMRTVLLGFLRLKHVLLVLDNFEQLLEGRGTLLELLQAAPFVKLLVTSRERLRLQAEVPVELGGLPYPPEAMPETGNNGPVRLPQSYPAVQLLLERAVRARPAGLALRMQNQPDLHRRPWDKTPEADRRELEAAAQVCRLVDGMPLGIELAASLARDCSFEQIAVEVQRSLGVLEASLHDLPERQRSLRVSFEHSWDLLPESEREVFSRLSVFPGSFSVSAAQQVAGAALPWLIRLEDRSLVRRVGHGRYEIHPILRQFAAQKLQQFSRRVEEQARQAHAVYFFGFLCEREPEVKGRRQPEALREVDVEMENVQAAWDWAVERRAVDLLDQGAYTMMFFLEARSRWREGEQWFRRGVETLRSGSEIHSANIGAANLRNRVLGFLMACQGWFCCRLTQFQQAEALTLGSLELLGQSSQGRERVFAHFVLGFLYIWMGRFAEAALHLRTCRELAEKWNDPWAGAWANELLIEMAFESGKVDLTEAPFLRSLATFEAIGEERGVGRVLNYLGNIALGLNRLAEARSYFERLLVTMEKVQDMWGAAGGTSKLGQLAFASGEFLQARKLHQRSLQMFQRMGDQRRSAYALRELAETECALGHQAEAEAYFQQALEIASRLRSPSLAQDLLTGLAAQLLNRQQAASAAELLSLVLALPESDPLTARRAAQLMETARAALAQEPSPGVAGGVQEGEIWKAVDRFLREGVRLSPN
jgi:predicted ATPase/DNA-binding SARP family transcriptional activator